FKNNKNLIRFLPNDIKPFNRFSEVISYFHLIDQHISINQWIKAWKVSNVVKKETINLVSAVENYKCNDINVMLLYKLDEELIKNNKNLIRLLPNNIKPFNRFSEVISYFHLIDQHISINQWIKAWKVSNVVKKETINLVSAVENYKCNDINVMLLYKLDEELINS